MLEACRFRNTQQTKKGVLFLDTYWLCVAAGELGKLEMLHEGILHKCIQQLLEKKKNTPLRDMAEDLECLCQIIRTVGPRLDSHKARVSENFYIILHTDSRAEIFAEITIIRSVVLYQSTD